MTQQDPSQQQPDQQEQPEQQPVYAPPPQGAPLSGRPSTPPPPPTYTPPQAPQAASATASTSTNILAILSLVAAFIIPLAAIILGHIGLSQIKKTGEQGRGLALAGTICGYVFTAIALIIIIFYVIFISVILSNPYMY